MNDENGGQTGKAFRVSDAVKKSQSESLAAQQASARARQEKTATEIARQRVLEAYKKQPQNYRAPSEASPQPRANAEDWRKYHTAWQDYYQKYYGDYYSKAAQDYINRERERYQKEQNAKLLLAAQAVRDARAEAAAAKEKASQGGSTLERAATINNSENIQQDFRAHIREKVAKRARKMRKSRHFIPLTIGITILILGLLLQYNQVIIANAMAYMSPGGNVVNPITALDPTVSAVVHDEPTLMIPKINVEVPVSFPDGNDVDTMDIAMSNGVAHFSVRGANALPGEAGNFVVSGHSAGNVYQNSNYKFIFSGLLRLEPGDMIYMDYDGARYAYRMTGSKTVDPSDVQALVDITNDNLGKPMITLITCTPLGTSKYRLLVYAEQVSPEYTDVGVTEPFIITDDDRLAVMPANDPSPLEQFWTWASGN